MHHINDTSIFYNSLLNLNLKINALVSQTMNNDYFKLQMESDNDIKITGHIMTFCNSFIYTELTNDRMSQLLFSNYYYFLFLVTS